MSKRKTFAIGKNLTDGLTQTMHSAKTYAAELRYEAIPLQRIETDPENPRDLFISFSELPSGPNKNDPNYEKKLDEIKSLESLANSIKKEGVLNAVIVYKHNEKYRLVAGERRCLASLLAGKQDIHAKILDKKPDLFQKSMLQWIENIEREDLSLWERMQNLKMILDNYVTDTLNGKKLSSTQLSEILGCSRQNANNYASVLDSPKQLMQAIQDGKVNNLEKAAYIARIESENERQKALIACINGESLAAIKKLIHKNQENPSNLKPPVTEQLHKKEDDSKIKLGYTSTPSTIQKIIDLFLQHTHYERYKPHFDEYNLSKHADASKAFFRLIEILETE